jgi:hypothetical protein
VRVRKRIHTHLTSERATGPGGMASESAGGRKRESTQNGSIRKTLHRGH